VSTPDRADVSIAEDAWATIKAGYEATGYGYAAYPHMREADYGISLSKPEAIIHMVRRIPGVRLASYIERGWADNQDVAIIARDDRQNPWSPGFRSHKA